MQEAVDLWEVQQTPEKFASIKPLKAELLAAWRCTPRNRSSAPTLTTDLTSVPAPSGTGMYLTYAFRSIPTS